MVNDVSAEMVSKFLGELNLAEGYRVECVRLGPRQDATRTCHFLLGRDVTHGGGVTGTLLDL